MFLYYTQLRTTLAKNPLYEWSAHRRDLYLTTHNAHKHRHTPPVGFEPTIPASEWPQTHALDRSATGTSKNITHLHKKCLYKHLYDKTLYYSWEQRGMQTRRKSEIQTVRAQTCQNCTRHVSAKTRVIVQEGDSNLSLLWTPTEMLHLLSWLLVTIMDRWV